MRPPSISALTILHIIVGIVDSVVGLLFFLAFRESTSFAASFTGIQASYSLFLVPMGVAWFAFGILAIIVGGFIWNGKGWAWLLGLVLATNAFILGAFGLLMGSLLVTLPLAVYGLILIFLGLRQVRAYYGSTYMPGPFIFPPVPAARPTAPPFLAPAYGRLPHGPVVQQQYSQWLQFPLQHSVMRGLCTSCGAPLQSDASFCSTCGMRFR